MEVCRARGPGSPHVLSPLCECGGGGREGGREGGRRYITPLCVVLQETNQSFRDYLLKGHSAILKVSLYLVLVFYNHRPPPRLCAGHVHCITSVCMPNRKIWLPDC